MTDGPGEPLSAAPADTPPPAKESALARLVGVLFSPEETFASIARKPDWLVPLLLFMAISLFSGYVFAHHVDFLSAARTQMEARKMSPEQIDRAMTFNAALFKVIAYCAPIFSVIVFVIVAAILMLAYRMMGGEGNFKQYLSVTLYGWVPQIIQGLIVAGILVTRSEPFNVEGLPTLVRSNLAFLVDVHDHRVLFTFLSSFDVFTIWSLILMAIGFAHVSRFTKAKSATVLGTVWLIWTGLKLIPAAIGAMLGSRK